MKQAIILTCLLVSQPLQGQEIIPRYDEVENPLIYDGCQNIDENFTANKCFKKSIDKHIFENFDSSILK